MTYNLVRRAWPRLRGSRAAMLLGTVAWIVDDDMTMPLVGLQPLPHRIPARNHFYAAIAHMIHGAAVVGVDEALRRVGALEGAEGHDGPEAEERVARSLDARGSLGLVGQDRARVVHAFTQGLAAEKPVP